MCRGVQGVCLKWMKGQHGNRVKMYGFGYCFLIAISFYGMLSCLPLWAAFEGHRTFQAGQGFHYSHYFDSLHDAHLRHGCLK